MEDKVKRDSLPKLKTPVYILAFYLPKSVITKIRIWLLKEIDIPHKA